MYQTSHFIERYQLETTAQFFAWAILLLSNCGYTRCLKSVSFFTIRQIVIVIQQRFQHREIFARFEAASTQTNTRCDYTDDIFFDLHIVRHFYQRIKHHQNSMRMQDQLCVTTQKQQSESFSGSSTLFAYFDGHRRRMYTCIKWLNEQQFQSSLNTWCDRIVGVLYLRLIPFWVCYRRVKKTIENCERGQGWIKSYVLGRRMIACRPILPHWSQQFEATVEIGGELRKKISKSVILIWKM